VGQIDRQIQEVIPDRDQPLLLHCRTGKRSAVAKVKLDQLGYKDVRDLGSIDAARAALSLPGS
jgi:phage shock protein E